MAWVAVRNEDADGVGLAHGVPSCKSGHHFLDHGLDQFRAVMA
jgi:hypothetical protein